MYFVIKGRLNVYGEKDKADIMKEKEKLKEAQAKTANVESTQNEQTEHKVIVEEKSEENSEEKPREHGIVNVFKIMNVVRNFKRTLAKHEREKEKEKKKSNVLNFQEFPQLHQFIDEGVITVNQLSTIESGTVFGEIALSRKKPRSATVIATEETHLGVLTKKDFDEILYELENDRINKLAGFFQESLKMNIARDNVARFAFIFEKTKFTIQSVVFKKGEYAEGFYLVKSGQVLVIF
jgi:cAMP-binding proteins - catabolite gene activator and regulatory subunit of cAMP-dependent protein kinases